MDIGRMVPSNDIILAAENLWEMVIRGFIISLSSMDGLVARFHFSISLFVLYAQWC